MSSFVRKTPRRQRTLPKGTWLSVLDGQLLTSTGVASLDTTLGGGLPVGTVVLVGEDEHTRHSETLMTMFLAQGLADGHDIFLTSAEPPAEDFVKGLPQAAKKSDKVAPQRGHGEHDALSIAWRYQNVKQRFAQEAGFEQDQAAQFDFSSHVDPEVIGQRAVCVDWPVTLTEQERVLGNQKDGYAALLARLTEVVGNHRTQSVRPDAEQPPTMLRIGVLSLGALSWCSPNEDNYTSLTAFMLSLRALARSAYAVVMVTVPLYLWPSWLASRLQHAADCAFTLESFTANRFQQSQLFRDYQGLLHLTRPFQVGSLVPKLPECQSIAFKARPGKLIFEPMHLPPDLGETVSRSSASAVPKNSHGMPVGQSPASLSF